MTGPLDRTRWYVPFNAALKTRQRRDTTRGASMARHDRLERYLDGYASMLADASATGIRLTRDKLNSHRALGEQSAEAGCGLRALVAAHLSETRASLYGRSDMGPACATSRTLRPEAAVRARTTGLH